MFSLDHSQTSQKVQDRDRIKFLKSSGKELVKFEMSFNSFQGPTSNSSVQKQKLNHQVNNSK